MKGLILLLLLSISFLCSAEDFISCASPEESCSCPQPAQVRIPASLNLKDTIENRHAFLCRSLQILEINDLAQKRVPMTFCPEEIPNTLYDLVTNSFPRGCGYTVKKFNVPAFRRKIQVILGHKAIDCGPQDNSMCTSAVFLAFVMKLRNLHSKGEITTEQLEEWSDPSHGPYDYLNFQARPDLMLSTIGLGDGKTLRSPSIPEDGWPREGDIVQFWRNDGSGHSTIFSGFLKDSQGVVKGLCFWSSNLDTNGYGTFCEDMRQVNRVIVGRFKE